MDYNKKVLWISDFNLSHTPGGAQRSNALIIDKGRELGLSILEANYNFNFKTTNFNDYDILISSNLESIYRNEEGIVAKIASHPNHSRLEHDLNRYLKQEDRIKLFQSCKKTILLTDLHRKLFEANYGNIFKNIEIVSDPIDTDVFYNKNLEREDKILYIGFMHELKGTLGFFEFVFANPEIKFVIAGWGSKTFDFLARNVPNVEYLGPIKYEDMSNVYNKYKSLYYSPVLPEPFCRSVGEAVLCGVELISSSAKIIGCLDELNKVGEPKFKENCKNAPETFWNKVLSE